MALISSKNDVCAISTHHGMGTIMSHRVYGDYADDCLAAVQCELKYLENTLSRFDPESDISRINRSAGLKYEIVSPETMDVLSQATKFSTHYPDCFDITIAPLVSLWKNNQGNSTPPEAQDIEKALMFVDYMDLIINPSRRMAGLQRIGQSIDLGGIGKGYAGDKVLEIYRDFGISSAYSNLGGNVVTLGAKPDGSPWQIGIQHPRQEDRLIGAVSVYGKSVVTSGDYQRFFIDNQGVRQHHILDPMTGYPARSGLTSVSIVANNSMLADMLSTAVFVAGLEYGLEILGTFPETDAVFVDENMRVFVTSGLEDSFQPGDGIDVNIFERVVR